MKTLALAILVLSSCYVESEPDTNVVSQALPGAGEDVMCFAQPTYEGCCVPPTIGGCRPGIQPVQYCCSYGDSGQLTWCGNLRGLCRPNPLP